MGRAVRHLFSFILISSVPVSETLAQSSVQDRILERTSIGKLDESKVASTMIVTIAGSGAFFQFRDEGRIAQARAQTRVQKLFEGTPDGLHPYMQTAKTLLKDSRKGDVVHVEYHVKGLDALRTAEDEIRQTWLMWEDDVVRSANAVQNASREFRAPVKKGRPDPVSELRRRLVFAENSRDRARRAYQEIWGTRTGFEKAIAQGGVEHTGPIRVYREFIVREGVDFEMFDFFKRTMRYESAESQRLRVPGLLVRRTDFKNLSVASRAARASKLGLAGALVSVGLVIEEFEDGRIADLLRETKERRAH